MKELFPKDSDGNCPGVCVRGENPLAAIAMVDGDMDTVMKNQATFNESREKAIRAEQMKKTPRPAAGSDGTGGMDYTKKIEEAQASGDLTAVAYYTRLKAQDEANQMKE